MRPWVLLTQAGIPFEEIMVRFGANTFDADSAFKQAVLAINPAGLVPILEDDGLVIWDTLAISEYLAEKYPEKHLWPKEVKARAHARSICAEMHAGFGALRSNCPMNIEASLPQIGALAWRDKPAVRNDVQRLVDMWTPLLAQSTGDQMLFSAFSIADAYFAPVCMRLKTYQLPVPAHITAYVERVCALPGVKSWIDQALAEHDFVDADEPYRVSGPLSAA